ncbi:MAG: heme-binding domain-containing protein [Gemmatimonadota bacterium]
MKKPSGRSLAYLAAGLVVALILAQLIPVNRSNPPIGAELEAPAAVLEVLRRSCYDCHSNETTWPWYSRVAPVSWLVARDVSEGREAVNYSVWGSYPAGELAELLEETWEEVAEGEMPPAMYVWLHSEARLTTADREILRSWAADGDR